MLSEDWTFIRFTVGMAVLSTLLVLPAGMAVAWALAKGRWPGKTMVETLISLPLVLPPVVTGLVLLKLFGRRGFLGSWLYHHAGIEIVFTWKAVAIALAVMSFPLFVRGARTAFEEVNPIFEELARTLGAGPWRVFLTISLPLARRGILSGTLLAFARALGEFGATIMVAGNIPGQTTTLSVAVYQYVQNGEDHHAWLLAGVSVLIAFGAVWASEHLQKRARS